MDQMKESIRSIEAAEKMAPAGSHEQGELVRAALYSAWPTIKAYAQIHGLRDRGQ